jgi:hypothetical protein
MLRDGYSEDDKPMIRAISLRACLIILAEEDLVTDKTIFGFAALAVLIATPALAADMAIKAAPRAPMPMATT